MENTQNAKYTVLKSICVIELRAELATSVCHTVFYYKEPMADKLLLFRLGYLTDTFLKKNSVTLRKITIFVAFKQI